MSGERQPIDIVLSCLKWAALLAFLSIATINFLSWRWRIPSGHALLPVVMTVGSLGLLAPAVFFGHRLSGDGSPATFADLRNHSPWWVISLSVLLFFNAFASFVIRVGAVDDARAVHVFSGACAVFAFASFAVFRAAQTLPTEPTMPPRERKWWDKPMMRIGFWD